MTNAIVIDATSTMSINYCNKEVKHKVNCYVLNTVLLLIMLRFIITIMCYQYGMHRFKSKKYFDVLAIRKWEIMNLKKVHMKNRTCSYFDNTI